MIQITLMMKMDQGLDMNALTRKNILFLMKHECKHAFKIVKRLINEMCSLGHPDSSNSFYVAQDASNFRIGAVLMQKHCNSLYGCEY